MNDSYSDPPRYSRTVAVRLAEISIEFLESCEAERLIEVRPAAAPERLYSAGDIRRLAMLRRLHEVLELRLQDLDVVLHLRSQLLSLQEEAREMEREHLAREQALLEELASLRQRLAEEADWR